MTNYLSIILINDQDISNDLKTLKRLAYEYRKEWNKKLCNSEDIEEYGLNEYLGGKAEGFEESLKLLKKINNSHR